MMTFSEMFRIIEKTAGSKLDGDCASCPVTSPTLLFRFVKVLFRLSMMPDTRISFSHAKSFSLSASKRFSPFRRAAGPALLLLSPLSCGSGRIHPAVTSTTLSSWASSFQMQSHDTGAFSLSLWVRSISRRDRQEAEPESCR